MAATPSIDFAANKRVPFDDTIIELGANYSGAAPLMELRAEPGNQGAPLASLGQSTSGGQGLTVTYDAAFPHPVTSAPGPATIVRIIINETTLEGLGYAADPSLPVDVFYDIHITPSGGKKFVFARGRMRVDPGVTL